MAWDIKIGEMRTRIRVQSRRIETDAEGYQMENWKDVFRTPIRCKWVWEHGKEALDSQRLQLAQTATITCWYTGKITQQCRVVRTDDTPATEWEIVRINVIEDRRKLMEIIARRRDKA